MFSEWLESRATELLLGCRRSSLGGRELVRIRVCGVSAYGALLAILTSECWFFLIKVGAKSWFTRYPGIKFARDSYSTGYESITPNL